MTMYSRSTDRKARQAAALQLFARRYARKAQPGSDPNDRRYDRRVAADADRMKPQDLDDLLRYGETNSDPV